MVAAAVQREGQHPRHPQLERRRGGGRRQPPLGVQLHLRAVHRTVRRIEQRSGAGLTQLDRRTDGAEQQRKPQRERHSFLGLFRFTDALRLAPGPRTAGRRFILWERTELLAA